VAERAGLTVVIVSYQSANELPACLASIVAACEPSDEVIVVDNASPDGSAEVARRWSPRVTVVANDRNLGFAAAANQGVRVASRPLCLLLNPDTIVTREAIKQLVLCLDRQGAGALVAPRLMNADGSVQRSAFRFPTPGVLLLEQTNLARRWPGFDPTLRATDDVAVDWLKGACLLSPTTLLRAHGPFDEGFFMFGEDVDLCLRLRHAGIRAVYCPRARIVHLGGMSTQRRARRMTLEFVRSTYRLYRRHGWHDRLPTAVAVIRATALLKAIRSIWTAGIAAALGRRDEVARHAETIGTFARMVALPSRGREPSTTVARSDAEEVTAMVERNVREPAMSPPIQEAPPEERPTAAQGSFAVLVSFAVIAVLNYGFAVVLSWLLPVEGYGVLGIAQAILLMTSTVVSAGFPWALAHLMARTEDPARRARAFRTGLAANLALGGTICAVVAVLGLSGLVRPVDAYAPTLILVAVTTAVLSTNAILASTLQGLLRLAALAFVRASEVLVKAIAGVGFVLLGLGTTGAVFGFLVGAAVATALAAWLLRDLPLAAGHGRGDRRLFGAARPFFIGMVGFALLSQLDVLTVKMFSDELRSDLLAGQYQVALTLSRIPFFAAMALFGAIFPYVARDLGRGDVARAYARLALKYTLLFIVPIGLVLMAIPDSAIRLFFSAKYDQSAAPLIYAAAASVILTLAYGVSILLQAQGRAGRPAVALMIAVPTQLVLAALMVPVLGMTGAAVAMGAAATLVLALLAPSVIRAFRLQPSASEVARYGAALAMLAGTFAVLPHMDRLTTAVTIAAVATVYLVVLVVLRLVTAQDVETLGGALGSRGLRVRRRIADVVDAVQTWTLPR